MDNQQDIDVAQVRRDASSKQSLAYAVGNTSGRAETESVKLATNGIYRFRMRHPFLYGLVAFIAGSLVFDVFAVMMYLQLTDTSPDFIAMIVRLGVGGIGGGIVMVLLAFAYTRMIRPIVEVLAPDQATPAAE